MATTRAIEPWDEIFNRGRKDGSLVAQTSKFARPAKKAPIPENLNPDLVSSLAENGIQHLWSHQATAVQAAWKQSVIVTTGTASGKSLCFNIPVLDTLSNDGRARALYLYPTKALAQDQARALTAIGIASARPAIYDGDTPREQRSQIRRNANVVFTNPDMLHVGILPNHQAWGKFFANLAIVVIDEAHVYRGVFGSHVANVIRRLRRIASAYGTEPRFLMASATIANPAELAQRLTGLEDFAVIDEDGAPTAKRTIAMWNPPLQDENEGKRRSPLVEAADLLAELVENEARTIVFMKSRKGIELIARFTKLELEKRGHAGLAERVAPYRAGYTSQQRRGLEKRLVSGDLLGIVATDALELGIDIGSLDAAICVTFPGTVASLKQMWGRAGRRGRGLAMYIAGDDGLDQFFCRHPDEFLDRSVEAAILNHENNQIYAAHLLCAAHEGPLEKIDAETLGPRWLATAEWLEVQGQLRRARSRESRATTDDPIFIPQHAEDYPAAAVSLRAATPDAFSVVNVNSGELLGTVDCARAYSTAHEGAVYLHGAQSFEVAVLDIPDQQILVSPFEGDWYTQPKRDIDTNILELLDRRDTFGVQLSFGKVVVTDHVLGYQRKSLSDHKAFDMIPLTLPQTSFETEALWYEIPDELISEDFPLTELLGSLHASEHSQIAVLPLLAMCDRWDIGGLSTNLHQQTGRATIFIYDGYPGGIGISRQGFLEFETLVSDALRLVRECQCAFGCPSCIQSPKCGNLNEPLSKNGAIEIMTKMTGVSVIQKAQ